MNLFDRFLPGLTENGRDSYVECLGSALLAPLAAIQHAIPSPSPDLRVVFMIAAESMKESA